MTNSNNFFDYLNNNSNDIQNLNWDRANRIIENATKESILRVLSKDRITFDDFLELISPKALDFLPLIATKANSITIKRFGRVINLYAPIYLSNECTNSCTYCRFNHNNLIERKTLTHNEANSEMEVLKSKGFDSIILLTGEAPAVVSYSYIKDMVVLAKKYFTYISLEVYPMSNEEYSGLVDVGVSGLTIYQETYNQESYKTFHKRGKKSSYQWRLNTPDRAFQGGVRKVGIGALLGLYDFRFETFMLANHLLYLQKRYHKGELAVSFPRINSIGDSFSIPSKVSDKELILIISALRLLFEDIPFVLSTRERAAFRDNLIFFCMTHVSAGAKTNPGGYSIGCDSGTQFDVSDERNVEEIVKLINDNLYDVAFKDWDSNFLRI